MRGEASEDDTLASFVLAPIRGLLSPDCASTCYNINNTSALYLSIRLGQHVSPKYGSAAELVAH